MASPSVLRSSRAATFSSFKSAKSNLKRASRPAPLPLSPSPFPFTASFNVLISASARSPHVHFPPTPLLYSTLSPPSFNGSSVLGSLPTSANILEPPMSAEPLESPVLLSPALSLVGLKSPKPRAKPAGHFQDPRSPRPAPMASLHAAALALGSRGPAELCRSLTNYPRSPYPSASAHTDVKSDDAPDNEQPRKGLMRRNTADNAILATRNAVKPDVNDSSNRTATVTFQLTSSRRLAPPHLDLSAAMVHPSNNNNTLSPVREFELDLMENDGEGDIFSPTIPESARLSNAFWESVSLEDGMLDVAAEGDGGFPESVAGSQVSDTEEQQGSLLNTHDREPAFVPRSPALLFGDSDGALWSPGIPRVQDQPHVTPSGFLTIKRSMFTAPSPKDPFARFPTFASTIQMVGGTSSMDQIKPPPRAHLL